MWLCVYINSMLYRHKCQVTWCRKVTMGTCYNFGNSAVKSWYKLIAMCTCFICKDNSAKLQGVTMVTMYRNDIIRGRFIHKYWRI